MKRMTYECNKCKGGSNGAGFSFMLVESEGKLTMVVSGDMEELQSHSCRQEHMLQIFGDALAKIKGGKALETPPREDLKRTHPQEDAA